MIATIPAYPDFGQQLSFILLGFFLVMFVLSLLSGATAGIGVYFRRAEARRPLLAADVPLAAAAPPAPAGVDAGANREAAVIAAAVSAMVEVPHRIVSVRPDDPER